MRQGFDDPELCGLCGLKINSVFAERNCCTKCNENIEDDISRREYELGVNN